MCEEKAVRKTISKGLAESFLKLCLFIFNCIFLNTGAHKKESFAAIAQSQFYSEIKHQQQRLYSPARPLLLPLSFTDHALCWKTCRGSLRNRVPNWGLFTSSEDESDRIGPESPPSPSTANTPWGAAILEVTKACALMSAAFKEPRKCETFHLWINCSCANSV